MLRKLYIFGMLTLLASPGHSDEYLFSVPPTETRAVSADLYIPIAEFLTFVSGHEIRYEYSNNWPTYLRNMQQANYDFILDAPHFISWRIEKIEHSPLISLSDELVYSIVVKQDSEFASLIDLKGKQACSSSIPNLDALTLLDQYYSLWTQPKIIMMRGFDETMEALQVEHCQAAVLPREVYRKLSEDPEYDNTRILFESQVLPHYGISSSPRINQNLKDRIQSALLSEEGKVAMKPLLDYYGIRNEEGPIAVDSEDYLGYAYLLSEYWGF